MNEYSESIHVALPRIIAELPAIGKDSEMLQGPRYRYRGIDDIMPKVKEAFGKHGVHVDPTYEVLADEKYQSERGAQMTRVVLKGTFSFGASDGTSVTSQTIGEARDSGDKAYNKAMTAAYKYALIQVLAISGQDDSDDYTPDPVAVQEVLPTPNFDALKDLGPEIAKHNLRDKVKNWAAEQVPAIDLHKGADDARVGFVVAFAKSELDVAVGLASESDDDRAS